MMTKIEIHPPDYNDSYSRIALDGAVYLIRFTWNEAAGRWSFGLYTAQMEPIAVGIRIVPNFPLNLQIVDDGFPFGAFVAVTSLDAIGREDFLNGKVVFAYVSAKGLPA